MIVATLPLGWRLTIYLLAGIAAGIANGVAGGGTFVTFPTLLATGASALTANVTTTVGVVPSYLGGIRGFRFQLRGHRDLIRSLVPSCLLGTALGCSLLLLGSPQLFALVVPWLIGSGTLLFAMAPLITKRLAHVDHAHPARRWGLFVGYLRRGDLRRLLRRRHGDPLARRDGPLPALRDPRTPRTAQRAVVDHQRSSRR